MEFRILGPLEVLREGASVELGHTKQRAVLGALLLHRGEVVSTERLIDELWGESPPPTATKIVQVYVSRLRKALDDAAATLVRTQAPGYVFQLLEGVVDADRFESLVAQARRERESDELARAAASYREALALWRGRALGDLTFESFAANEAERLNELRLEALTERIDCDLRLGRHGELVGELEAVVAEHPLREPLRGQLMLALYRSGRQADALEAYVATRRALRDELGLEPSPELRRLEQEILRHDEGLQVAEPRHLEPKSAPLSATVRARKPAMGKAVAAGGAAAICVLALAAFVATRGAARPQLIHPNSVVVFDPASGKLLADVPVGVDPASITAGFGSVWVGNLADGTVSRIDPSAKRLLRTISVGAPPRALAANGDGVWVRSGTSVVRINPEFDNVVSSTPLDREQRSGTTAPTATIRRGLWVPTSEGIEHLDTSAGRPDDSFATGSGGPSAIASGEGALWVAQAEQKVVVRIDRTRAQTPIRLPDVPTGIDVGGGAVWAVTAGNTLIRIDPTSASVVTTIAVGARPTAVAVGGGWVWVANGLDGTISQVDPSSNKVARTIDVGSSPQNIAWIDGKLWVPVQELLSPADPAKAGQTLRIESQLTDIGGFDPALNSTTYGVQFDYATCLELLNHPDAGGPTATRLVPEAATALPAVSTDGRTYTFTIRKGFRFSPPSGEPVTAATFRYSIERSLSPKMKSDLQYAPNIFNDIVGFRAFEAGRTKHIAGITVQGNRLSIRLAARRPDFLQRVTTPFFCAVPVGTPLDPRGVHEIPAAGPYYVASERRTQVVLERNPNYGGDRPHRFDRIVFTGGVSQAQATSDIQRNRADYALDGLPRKAIGRIVARYGPRSPAAAAGRQRYFAATQLSVQYLVLNTRRRLFSRLRLRRAVNYAIDRATLASLGAPSSDPSVGGPQIATSHYLPPGMSGYREAGAYPLRPDLRRARQLSRGLGGRAIMYSCDFDVCDAVAQTVRSNLKAIGIEVEIRRWSIDEMYARESEPNASFDIGIAGWGADYPDPANFLNALFDGHSIASGSNMSKFDEELWNRRLEAANRLTGDARDRAYAQLDLALGRDAAPAAPVSYRTRGEFFSSRIGCQIEQPAAYGVDLAALCRRQ